MRKKIISELNRKCIRKMGSLHNSSIVELEQRLELDGQLEMDQRQQRQQPLRRGEGQQTKEENAKSFN